MHPRWLRRLHRLTLLIAFLSVALMLSQPSAAQDKEEVHVYKGARIHTAAGPVLERGVLVVARGKVVAVGPENDVTIPRGARVHDLTGKTIIPGLVDTHSHVGIFARPGVSAHQDGNEMTGPVQPGL